MKRLIIVCAMFLGMLSYSVAWSHHMAEGVISDEIWLKVDGILDGTPHSELNLDANLETMDIDMDDVWDTMVIIDEGGNPVLVSSVEVATDDVADYLEVVNFMALLVTGFPSGSANGDTASQVEIFEDPNTGDDDTSYIVIYEQLGGGTWQEDELPAADDATPSQNRNG